MNDKSILVFGTMLIFFGFITLNDSIQSNQTQQEGYFDIGGHQVCYGFLEEGLITLKNREATNYLCVDKEFLVRIIQGNGGLRVTCFNEYLLVSNEEISNGGEYFLPKPSENEKLHCYFTELDPKSMVQFIVSEIKQVQSVQEKTENVQLSFDKKKKVIKVDVRI